MSTSAERKAAGQALRGVLARHRLLPGRTAAYLSTEVEKWLWPTFRDGDKSGVSCGAVIISFVIMPGVRS
jgi:hypothetical protein